MTKRTGLGQALYVDGNDLSGDIGSLSRVGGGPTALEVTGIDKDGFERIGGTLDGAIAFDAWFNPTGEHPVLSALPTTDTDVMYVMVPSVGGEGAALGAKQMNYDGTRGSDGSLAFTVEATANGFGIDMGVMLTAGIRTDTGATNGATVDQTEVTTSFGWSAHLHVFSVTGTSVTVELEDSANGSTWAALSGGAFTAVTPGGAPQAQRLEGGATATVRRYIRATTSGTFSNAQFAVLFRRGEA